MFEDKVYIYSQLPITRTFKGNRKRFELSGVRVIGSSKKIAGSKEKNSFYCTVSILDLLTSRAFERVARNASERKLVPGPTTPDQKTKRTTLRKSMSILITSNCKNVE